MKQDKLDPYAESAVAAVLGDASLTEICADDVKGMLDVVGIRAPMADGIAQEIVDRYNSYAEPQWHGDFQTAWNAGLASATWRAKDLLRQQEPAVAPPPSRFRELDEVPIEGHGSVCGAEYVRRGTERPLLWLWFKANENAPCDRYEWYQFVFIDLYVDRALRSYDVPEDRRTIQVVTELDATLAIWNPDYHVAANAAAEAAQGHPNPAFKPDSAGFGNPEVKPAKPFHKTILHIPGRPEGIEDGPNWCTRGRDSSGRLMPSALERLWRRLPDRNRVRHVGPPPAGSDVVELRFEFRTYLICLPDESCIGYQNWKYRNKVTINYQWELVPGQPPPELGITAAHPPRLWRAAPDASACTHTMEVGDWSSC